MGTDRLFGVLRCVGCRAGGLAPQGTALHCAVCGRLYPVQAGVPVMLEDAVAERGPLLSPGEARNLLAELNMPADAVNALRVRAASGARVRAGGACLQEDGRILGRAPAAAGEDGALQVEWGVEYLPRAMRPGEELVANVWLRNAGRTAMAYAGETRLTVATQWSDLAGEPVRAEEVRTPLPVSLAPGQALTLPVRLIAPGVAGRFALRLRMVREGVDWLPQALGPVLVRVDPAASFTPPPHWVLDGPGPHEAGADRERGLGMLREWLAGRAEPRLLELGGGADPALARLGLAGVSVDGDLLALQLASLVPGRAGVLPVCADLADLPLPAGYFDAVICLSALHLQPTPAAVLRSVRPLLRRGGFVALLCEPAAPWWPGTAPAGLLAEFRRGRNPQHFALREWAQIFAAARLRATELVIDGTSMKARLIPEGADA